MNNLRWCHEVEAVRDAMTCLPPAIVSIHVLDGLALSCIAATSRDALDAMVA